jgi:flagellar motor switch protein FliN/FliY
MSDELLSQEELDALLKGNVASSDSNSPSSEEATGVLSAEEKDAIGEIGNISIGSSATVLSTLLGQKVEITTPNVYESTMEKIVDNFKDKEKVVITEISFKTGIKGKSIFILTPKEASTIADLMIGGDGTNTKEDLTDLELSAVSETMNQMMGSAATSMSEFFKKKVDIETPVTKFVDLDDLESLRDIFPSEPIIIVEFNLKIGDIIDSKMFQLLSIDYVKDIYAAMKGEVEKEVEEIPVVQQQQPAQQPQPQAAVYQQPTQQAQQVMYQQPPVQAQSQITQTSFVQQPIQPQYAPAPRQMYQNVQPAEFGQLNAEPTVPISKMDLLLDVPVEIVAVLGRKKMLLRDILDLGPGALIELDKLAGENLDILVNGKIIARGEVVVVDENFGLRITEIVSPQERIKNIE